ncbi:hypothetical protein KSP39_PZI022573 [Platanthera zijinensis]|uniref:Homeobox domain-containing protein n=1 Tax=Platanthera zijinensis TaxID=2320716 RepID=A0AAP0AVV5_9ASPA
MTVFFYSCASPPSSALFRVFFSGATPDSAADLFMHRCSKTSPVLRSPPRPLRSSFPVLFSRRQNSSSRETNPKLSKSKRNPDYGEEDGEEIDEDAFEALFSQLEEDLKNDEGFSDVGDDEITEDDLARLEQELGEALGEDESDEILKVLPSKLDGRIDSDEEEESRPKLKNWQLRQLAGALKVGRRKTSIKNLSAELGLERAYVLELLREPPPNLLMMCASLPNEVAKKSDPVSEPMKSDFDSNIDTPKKEPKDDEAPVHVMQTRWSMQKRIKKVHLATLERVYARTKRPTNAMISSIVHVTNLPWKRIVKWFEDKRLEDGVPVSREPFRRAVA